MADGQEIFLTQIAGERTETRPRSSIAPRSSVASPSRPSVGFDTASVKGVPPTGWKAGPVTGMRKACFRLDRGEKSLEVTVIPAGGDLLANVNRWRGQIGLTPISTEQLQKDAQGISAGKVTGKYVSLLGSEQAILAAIFPASGGGSWFVKMRGDRTLTEKETTTFKSFVNTLRFGPTF